MEARGVGRDGAPDPPITRNRGAAREAPPVIRRARHLPEHHDLLARAIEPFSSERRRCWRLAVPRRPGKIVRAGHDRGAGAGRAPARPGPGKKLGRPRVGEKVEAAIRRELAKGRGIHAVARAVGVGAGTVQRVRAELPNTA